MAQTINIRKNCIESFQVQGHQSTVLQAFIFVLRSMGKVIWGLVRFFGCSTASGHSKRNGTLAQSSVCHSPLELVHLLQSGGTGPAG